MACLQPDGSPTRCGEMILLALWNPATLGEASEECDVPLFRVRSAIREFVQAGLVEERNGRFRVAAKGIQVLEG